MITIGERIDDLMKEKGFTDESLAAEINKRNDPQDISISKSTIGDIKNNKDKGYSFKYFVALADVFGVSVDYLLGLREERTTNPNIQNAVEYTGLSESAAEKLHNAIDSNPYMALVISFLIDSFAVTVGENEIPAIYRTLSFAIWGDLISYPAEKRCNNMDGSTFWRHDVDALEKRTDQRTTIDTDVFPAAVFQRIITRLDKLRDKEQSEKHSEYLDKFVETVKRYEGGADNGKHN